VLFDEEKVVVTPTPAEAPEEPGFEAVFAITLFLFYKKKTCAKRKTLEMFLVKVFTEGKKSCW